MLSHLRVTSIMPFGDIINHKGHARGYHKGAGMTGGSCKGGMREMRVHLFVDLNDVSQHHTLPGRCIALQGSGRNGQNPQKNIYHPKI